MAGDTLLLLSPDAGVTEQEASAATHNGISDCCSWRSCERDAGDGGWSLKFQWVNYFALEVTGFGLTFLFKVERVFLLFSACVRAGKDN